MLLLNHWLIVQMWPAEIFSIGITLVVVLQNWFNWFHFLFFQGRSTCYSDRLHDFSVTILRCYKDVYVNSFFLCTARLWNSLSIECFPLTYDLNGFKSRVKNLTQCDPGFPLIWLSFGLFGTNFQTFIGHGFKSHGPLKTEIGAKAGEIWKHDIRRMAVKDFSISSAFSSSIWIDFSKSVA